MTAPADKSACAKCGGSGFFSPPDGNGVRPCPACAPAPVGGGEGAGVLTREDVESYLEFYEPLFEEERNALLAHDAALRAELDETRDGWAYAATELGKAEAEVERLRRIQLPLVCNGACCEHCAKKADALAVEVERLRDEWTFAAEVGTRLRAAIEAAPHDLACGLASHLPHMPGRSCADPCDAPCDCWKSKALEGSAR